MTSESLPMVQETNMFKPVGKKELNRDDFMVLFITQLQYQDPMKPMDSYEMASQLAQFSNMEATMKMADTTAELLDYQKSQNNLQLLDLLDSQVVINGNTMGVNGEDFGDGSFVLAEDSNSCVVEIFDSSGALVRAMDMGPLGAGAHDLNWDGKDTQGNGVEDGAYSYVLKAYNGSGQAIQAQYRSSGRVTGIHFESGQAMLAVDQYIESDVGNVISVVN